MLKHYQTNGGNYYDRAHANDRVTARQSSQIDTDMTVCYRLAWFVPVACFAGVVGAVVNFLFSLIHF
jgi:hypothetical protein